MEWSIWLGLGLFLLGLEMFTPTGMYLFIIGLACLAVGTLASMDVLVSTHAQAIVAGILTILFIVVLRKPFQSLLTRMSSAPLGSDITSQSVVIDGLIQPGALGKGQLSGTTWTVLNNTGETLTDGSRHPVKRVDGLTLVVSK